MQSTQPESTFVAQGPNVQELVAENTALKERVAHLERMLQVTLNHVEKAWAEGSIATIGALKAGAVEPPVNPYSDVKGEEHVIE